MVTIMKIINPQTLLQAYHLDYLTNDKIWSTSVFNFLFFYLNIIKYIMNVSVRF